MAGAERLTVKSHHRQGVDRIPESLPATAWADDDSVEAIESRDGSVALGVLWHPEEDPWAVAGSGGSSAGMPPALSIASASESGSSVAGWSLQKPKLARSTAAHTPISGRAMGGS
jgi:Peptidase C26